MFSSNCRSYPTTILNRLKMELIQKMALTFWTISKCWPCLDVLIQHGISTEAVPSVLFPFVAGFGQPWCCWLCVRHTSPLPDSRDQDEDRLATVGRTLGRKSVGPIIPYWPWCFSANSRATIPNWPWNFWNSSNRWQQKKYFTILHNTPLYPWGRGLAQSQGASN